MGGFGSEPTKRRAMPRARKVSSFSIGGSGTSKNEEDLGNDSTISLAMTFSTGLAGSGGQLSNIFIFVLTSIDFDSIRCEYIAVKANVVEAEVVEKLTNVVHDCIFTSPPGYAQSILIYPSDCILKWFEACDGILSWYYRWLR